MSKRLAGRSALVTGGAQGIGRAVVRGFVGEGARVAVLDHSEQGLAALRDELGADVLTIHGDVRDFGAHRQSIERTVGAYGRLDVLVPNAGVLDGFLQLHELTPEALNAGFDQVFAINVKGYLLAVRAALDSLRSARGCIVFTASTASHYPAGGGVIYTASKHAVLGLVRQLAYELAPDVRVNAVSPGGTLTELASAPALRSLIHPVDPAQHAARIEARTPLQRVQVPEDHVGAYILLASDEARAMTGTVIHSDGGIGVRG